MRIRNYELWGLIISQSRRLENNQHYVSFSFRGIFQRKFGGRTSTKKQRKVGGRIEEND